MIPLDLRDRLTVDVPTAGRALGLGRAASYEAARRGDLPTLTIGRRILVPVAQLLRLVGIEKNDGPAGTGTAVDVALPEKKDNCGQS